MICYSGSRMIIIASFAMTFHNNERRKRGRVLGLKSSLNSVDQPAHQAAQLPVTNIDSRRKLCDRSSPRNI